MFNLAGLRPILNSLNLGGIHLQSVFREDEAEVFDSVFRKTTLIWAGCIDHFHRDGGGPHGHVSYDPQGYQNK